MNIKDYMWLAPFCSFIFGYYGMQRMLRVPEIITPHFVGKHIYEILPLVTRYNLNIRLLDQKEESALPEGIILHQIPSAGTSIKPNQPLFIVTTKKPLAIRVPCCVGLMVDELVPLLQKEGILSRIYFIVHSYPEKMCFAQSPQQDDILDKEKLILYVSSGDNKQIIWPNFLGLPLQQVVDFLSMHHINPQIISSISSENYTDINCVVTDQRPFAGTLLTLDEHKPLLVQLRI